MRITNTQPEGVILQTEQLFCLVLLLSDFPHLGEDDPHVRRYSFST